MLAYKLKKYTVDLDTKQERSLEPPAGDGWQFVQLVSASADWFYVVWSNDNPPLAPSPPQNLGQMKP